MENQFRLHQSQLGGMECPCSSKPLRYTMKSDFSFVDNSVILAFFQWRNCGEIIDQIIGIQFIVS